MALRQQVVNLVQSDYGNELTIRLRDRRTRNYIDLTGITSAKLYFRSIEGTTTLFTENLTIESPLYEGRLTLRFTVNHLDIPAGRYEGEVELSNLARKLTPYELIQFRLREDVQ